MWPFALIALAFCSVVFYAACFRTIRLQGQLNKRLVPDVVREIAEKRLSGRLTFTQERIVRAILLDAGEPVCVSSNLPAEQIEHKLIKDGRATQGLIETAR